MAPADGRRDPGDLLMMIRSREPVVVGDALHAGRRTGRPLVMLMVAVLGLALLSLDVQADDTQGKPASADKPRVPRVSTEGPTKRIEGKIMRSSRGKKGPVRLLVERKEGDPVTVIVAPEEVCDRLGLSLKADEQVIVEGSLLKSDRPILIASAFVVDGKTIRVRDADGKIVDPGGSAAAPGIGAAVTGAPKPEASPKP
jgi:hypothetical protein